MSTYLHKCVFGQLEKQKTGDVDKSTKQNFN